ncbi:MAG TPA: Smr/MutS family protein [Treponemataceae bacterium]|nr:Smr/MutS family protein [Treponemataceae bacterium]
MNQRTLDILEYPRLREEIAGFCMSEEGKSSLLSRVPSADPEEVRTLKALGRVWLSGIRSDSAPPLAAWPPVRPLLPRLGLEGASFDVQEFYALLRFCETVESLRSWAARRKETASSHQRDALASLSFSDALLSDEAASLPDLSVPLAEILRIIDKSGELRDLPELRAIRQGILRIRQDIERLVHRYLADDNLKPMLQSSLPTLRDGRQVLALRANFKGRIKGIVHEVSQSGQTLYLEPEDVVDRNNDLVTEEYRLSREVARILRELASRLSPFAGDFSDALDRAIFLDCVGAGARWGNANLCAYAEEPQDGTGSADDVPVIRLKQARHPLLRPRAVPIDLVLSPGSRMLIVTGPNTGGKTVTLKTAALFALLNQSGWPLPAAEPSVLPVFDYIGCDIGDEQSLDQSLSTFSGHMKNISEILRSATPRSLVLLDELGSGTDPQEGGAIAMAVLDALLVARSVVLVTTHHGVLKNYGYTHPACVNASVDFDQNTLSPTYRILMGVPGESHALDIASRNGLDSRIIEQARTYILEERADVSALIRGLTAKHEELDRFEQNRKKEEQQLREKRRKNDLRELQLRQKEVELREQGCGRLEKLLAESRSQLENLVREIREGELTREKTVQVKSWMKELDSLVSAERDSFTEEKNAVKDARRETSERHGLEAREESASASAGATVGGRKGKPGRRETRRLREADSAFPQGSRQGPGGAIPEFAPGVEVYVGERKTRATLVREAKKGSWIVSAGTIRLTVSEDELTAVPVSSPGRAPVVEVHTELGGEESPAFELRLLGMRHDEAMKALEKQLDLAAMKGLQGFSVVHGKGHGVLQTAVHEALAASPVVQEFHFARPEEGGTGKTWVTLG